MFQSRAGFSECLDDSSCAALELPHSGFNPVLGFLSVSTVAPFPEAYVDRGFQSRAGFSECLDDPVRDVLDVIVVFQSRAGFSECLDRQCDDHVDARWARFNPVLGFLSVSTCRDLPDGTAERPVSIPCWVF